MTALFMLGGSVVPDRFQNLVPDEESLSTGAAYMYSQSICEYIIRREQQYICTY
jgi:hypothetical protein